DAAFCFRYAQLADDRGLAPATVRAALDRAVALRPQFDEVHFKLAIMDKNEGHAESAVEHLRQMREPLFGRAWAYYTNLADALLDRGRRDEARLAAQEALHQASSDSERERAGQLIWLANSVLSVEITADAKGEKQFRAVRVPVKAALRNPFFE